MREIDPHIGALYIYIVWLETSFAWNEGNPNITELRIWDLGAESCVDIP